MRSTLFLAVGAALVLTLIPSRLHASHATVPDDYATITAAIASAADTIFVKDGTYPDSILIDRSLVLLAAPATHQGPIPFPILGSVTVVPGGDVVIVRNIHIRGYVRQTSSMFDQETNFESCRIDSGLIAGGISNFNAFRVRGCTVLGGLDVFLYYSDISGNTVVGTLAVRSHGNAYVRGNYVPGPASEGIRACCQDGAVIVDDNVVSGVANGIVGVEPVTITANRIENCGETGILLPATNVGGMYHVTDNVIRRSGRHGIESLSGLHPTLDAQRNLIEDAAMDGMHLLSSAAMIRDNVVLRSGQRGIDASLSGALIGNHVLSSGAEGIVVTDADCRLNVVGRSGTNGLVTTAGGAQVSQNTSYANGGAGFHLAGAANDSAYRNIGYGNQGYGLVWAGAGTPRLSCNDWYANGNGATSGVAPGATDLAVNPGFCDLLHDDVSLSQSSPVLNPPGCGQIGALGQGCLMPASASAASEEPAGLRVTPSPAAGALEFSWRRMEGAAELDVYDIAGKRLWSRAVAGADGAATWNGVGDDGARLAPGVYFAKLVSGGRALTHRIVLVR